MNVEDNKCFVCNEPATMVGVGDNTDVTCDVCGEYRITGTAAKTLPNLDIENRLAVLELEIASAARSGGKPTISSWKYD